MLAVLLLESVKSIINLLKSTVVMESKTIYIVVVLQLSVSLTWKFNGNVVLK